MAVLDSSKLLEIFVSSDDFCQKFQETQLPSADTKTKIIDVPNALSTSEMMAMVLFYHLAEDFPDLCSYNRFVQKMPRFAFILDAF